MLGGGLRSRSAFLVVITFVTFITRASSGTRVIILASLLIFFRLETQNAI